MREEARACQDFGERLEERAKEMERDLKSRLREHWDHSTEAMSQIVEQADLELTEQQVNSFLDQEDRTTGSHIKEQKAALSTI